ncbi:globin [Pelomonas sp. HMWF004]|nr:globin [Pelomonas sp. HMWF004]
MVGTEVSELADLDRAGLRRLVDAFYVDVRADELLGPVFAKAIGDDWEPHLSRMTEFWSTVMLGTKSFKGKVYQTHAALADGAPVTPEHFLRWITLWTRHTQRLFPGAVADQLQRMAAGMGRNLLAGLFQQSTQVAV